MKKNYYKAIISYNGKNFHGWQSQPTQPSIQSTLRNTIKTIWNYDNNVEGCSRTDAGVHAYGQVTKLLLPANKSVHFLKKILNDNLPSSITIRSLEECNEQFSPRKHALKKLYYYNVAFTKPSPLIHDFVT